MSVSNVCAIACSLANFVGVLRHLKCLESKIHVTANFYSSFVFWCSLFCHFAQVRKNNEGSMNAIYLYCKYIDNGFPKPSNS